MEFQPYIYMFVAVVLYDLLMMGLKIAQRGFTGPYTISKSSLSSAVQAPSLQGLSNCLEDAGHAKLIYVSSGNVS